MRTKIIIFSLFFLALLTSCGMYKKTGREVPQNAQERARQNVEQGKGISIKGLLNKDGNTNYQFSSSNPMWRATLETLDFIPLSNVDYSGGIIITDWFDNENDENSNLKISIKFLTNEVRADGLDVSIFEKQCTDNICKTRKLENNVSIDIKKTILKKAALLVKNKKIKNSKEYFKKNTDLSESDKNF